MKLHIRSSFFNVRTYECRANYMNEIILLQSDSFTGTNNKRKNSFAPDVWLRRSVGRPSRYLNWALLGSNSVEAWVFFFPAAFLQFLKLHLTCDHLFTIRRSKITCFIKLRSTNHFTGMKKPLKFASIPTFGFVALLLLALLSRFFFSFFFFRFFFLAISLIASRWRLDDIGWYYFTYIDTFKPFYIYFYQMTAGNDLISSGGFRWLTGISSAIVKEQIRYKVGFLIKKFVSFNKVHCCLIIIR